MPARTKPKIDKAIELLESGGYPTFASAARAVGAQPSSVAQRWRQSKSGKPIPYSEDGIEVNKQASSEDMRAQLSIVRAKAAATREELAQVKRDNVELTSEVEELRSTLAVVEQVEDHPQPDWLLRPKKEKGPHRGSLLGLFSDFHIAEVVDPAEMNWYNAFNLEIAEFRVRRYFERCILMSREYLSGVKYDGFVLASLGDMLSGDIHEEFQQTNEVSTYDAIPYAVKWAERGVEMLLEEFGKVHVVSVPGNHPRDSRKPRYKKRSSHNADTLIWRLVATKFEDNPNVTFNIPDGISADFSMYDVRFRAEHGDEAKGGAGIQGAMLPLAMRTHKLRKQAQAEGSPFDIVLYGHWHQLMSLPARGFIVNGAGKGYDEYARGKAFEPEPPQQLLAVVTPEHGLSAQYPIFVGHREEEGW